MLSESEIPLDHLKIPTNERLVDSKPRRTSSFILNSNQLDERIASNLSLPSATHGILKQPNSSHRRPSTSSHLSVHYTSTAIEDEDKIEFHPSFIAPTIESAPLRKTNQLNNIRINNRQFLKMPRQNRIRDLLQKAGWSNPFLLGRSNDENTDAYKIFSIIYGLVIFIGGVAFSISHAIIPIEEAENIKHLAEIYFTYLYWVSICWITFCIFDIVHHRHKLTLNPTTIHKLGSNHIPMMSGKLDLRKSEHKSPLLNEQTANLPTTPDFNVHLFDDSDEFQSDDDDIDNIKERRGTISSKQSQDDNRDDYDSFPQSRRKSNSLDNLSTKSSIIMRNRGDTTRDALSRRPALDPGAAHNLRTYVRHRKDSIVQRVIGYNYDDNSTAGGLYIRVGIGIFCLGTVIHSGLSILSDFENLSCARWTAVMDDFSRLLFSFIQFFFIFKHSNLIIRAHESLARLAVMHIVVTNLCVWFRMVVIETKLQITEMGAHEMMTSQFTSGNYSTSGSQNSINQNYRSYLYSSNCIESIEEAQQMTAFINEGYMRLKPLLYPCTIEFSLMCLTLFFLIWENIGKTFAHKMSDKASTKNVFMVNCHASIKGLFAGMVIFSCTVISIILYAIFRNKMGDDMHSPSSGTNYQDNSHSNRMHARAIILTTITTTLSDQHNLVLGPNLPGHGPFTSISKTPKRVIYSIAIVEIVNLFLLVISLTATTWALIKIRKLQYKRTTTRFDDVLIIVSLAGTYLYSIFSAFALLNNKNPLTWIAHLKIAIVILEFIEGTVHAFFILVALRKRLHRTNKYQYPAREIITLLIILDLSLWFEETTTTTKHEANPFQLAFYHIIPWSIIAAIATPLQIFFRFHASVCLSHVWENMYILPAYEPVAPHGL